MLFFQDEGRFGRINNVQRCWAPPGSRPMVNREIIREFSYSFCSVCPKTGELYSMILPRCNTELMDLYLKKLGRHFLRYRIILCMDNATWHVSEHLHWPQNMAPLYLPPYSPELNPVELVWRYIRGHYFNNHTFQNHEQVDDHLQNALQFLYQHKQTVKSLTGFKWIISQN
jgi:putative transposase